MNKKKLIILGVAFFLICTLSWVFLLNNTHHKDNKNQVKNIVSEKNTQKNVQETSEEANSKALAPRQKEIKPAKKIVQEKDVLKDNTSSDLFNNIPSSALPLSAIAEISKLPANIQDAVVKIAENNNIYMLQKHNNKILIITDNNENIRHNIEFTEINLSNGHQIHTTLGYNDKIKDSNNDIWEYDDSTKLPTRHAKYNSEGDIEFVETWNYDNDNPIKYEMKDANYKVISMRKETLNGGTDLRIENLVYDEKGNTVINISAAYDGQDVKRFTYYNAENIKDSGSIFSEYNDGLKTKEVVYTSDLKVKNSYTSEYKDGEREEITKFDKNNNEVEKYIQIDSL